MLAGGTAFLVGGALMAREAAQSGHARYLGPVRKFLLCLCPALLAGAVLTFVLWHAGIERLLPGTWLLLYGCAVLSASTVTIREHHAAHRHHGRALRRVGISGLRACRPRYIRRFSALGFGALHIVFGLLIGRMSHAE